ncbi:DNA end-binding protein Ku [Rhodopseudomonas julia]|uniref:Non-homologous end joining protein Ku n=1 Tax=Rhodopseudomonas julia TaxID=200617 RepID=A0ABU0C5P1_9BRAD|nr:Ku protein [Rhodopseudomonas julia]MDQ0325810.1 DNA end-binding protein Ku [Rhodopseudomonas julia]
MPAVRPVWKGQLRLSLVSIPVELYSATKTSSKISFRQIHEPSGKPVKYQKVVPGVGPVDTDEILKGFEYEKGNYVLLSEDEIDEVKLETKKTLELTQFVGSCEIAPLYFDKPYFMVPQDELAEDAFRVVRDALRQSEKVGLGQLALRGKEYLVAIKPCGTGLLLETLHYEDEIRKSDSFFSGIGDEEADEDLLGVASELIERKTAPFDAAVFKDHYVKALRDVIDAKLKKKRPKVVESDEDEAPKRGGDNVIDLMAALKESLEKSDDGKSGGKSGRKSAAKTSSSSAKSRSGKASTGKSSSRPKSSSSAGRQRKSA